MKNFRRLLKRIRYEKLCHSPNPCKKQKNDVVIPAGNSDKHPDAIKTFWKLKGGTGYVQSLMVVDISRLFWPHNSVRKPWMKKGRVNQSTWSGRTHMAASSPICLAWYAAICGGVFMAWIPLRAHDQRLWRPEMEVSQIWLLFFFPTCSQLLWQVLFFGSITWRLEHMFSFSIICLLCHGCTQTARYIYVPGFCRALIMCVCGPVVEPLSLYWTDL